MSYLLVLGISGGAGAFVPGGGASVCFGSQPVSATLMTMPNNTIKVYILFIVGLTFTKTAKGTSKNLPIFLLPAGDQPSLGEGVGKGPQADCAEEHQHSGR
jgi:hypothetical protein